MVAQEIVEGDVMIQFCVLLCSAYHCTVREAWQRSGATTIVVVVMMMMVFNNHWRHCRQLLRLVIPIICSR